MANEAGTLIAESMIDCETCPELRIPKNISSLTHQRNDVVARALLRLPEAISKSAEKLG